MSTELLKKKLFLSLPFALVALCFFIFSLVLFFTAEDKELLCERSKNMCTISSKRIIDLSPTESFIKLSKIEKVYTKSEIRESSDGETARTHYTLCAKTPERRCLEIFDSYDLGVADLYTAEMDFNQYLTSQNKNFSVKKKKNHQIWGAFLLIFFSLIGWTILYEIISAKKLKKVQYGAKTYYLTEK